MNKMTKEFAMRLLQSRVQTPQKLQRSQTSYRRHRPRHVKGVVKGNFVRVKLPPGPPPPSRLPKLPSPATTPVKPFSQPTTTTTTLQELATPRQAFWHEYWDRLRAWTRHNFAVIVLNFGSVCSLVGFTRSDVRVTTKIHSPTTLAAHSPLFVAIVRSLNYVCYRSPGPCPMSFISWPCPRPAIGPPFYGP